MGKKPETAKTAEWICLTRKKKTTTGIHKMPNTEHRHCNMQTDDSRTVVCSKDGASGAGGVV